jgi:serine/threonine protein kinase
MGIVYLAEHRLMERQVAIKVISKSLLDNSEALERFHREVRAAAKLDHKNIVRAYDAEQAGDLHMLVMEYVEGLSLAQVLAGRGALPVVQSCAYIRQAALALQHAFEKGMVHRDLKPQNLILIPGEKVIKVLDFGLARLASERQQGKELTTENAIMGTPEYIAPEQATDARQADIRADIYSLGCTLYCLLAGRPPFVEQTAMRTILAQVGKVAVLLHELRPDVPAGLSTVVARMIAKDPKQRYQMPIEVADALAPFCTPSENPATAAAVSPRNDLALVETGSGKQKELHQPMTSRRRRRIPVLTITTAVVALGLLMGTILLVRLGQRVHYLSDRTPFDGQVSGGRFADRGHLGYTAGGSSRIRVNGKESPHGLSMCPDSNTYAWVKYRLGKTAQTFLASVALNDSAGGPGLPPGVGKIPTPLTFQVLGDGEILWSSKPVDIVRLVQECRVDVSEVDVLELRVDCPGDYTNAQAVWLEPRVLLK